MQFTTCLPYLTPNLPPTPLPFPLLPYPPTYVPYPVEPLTLESEQERQLAFPTSEGGCGAYFMSYISIIYSCLNRCTFILPLHFMVSSFNSKLWSPYVV